MFVGLLRNGAPLAHVRVMSVSRVMSVVAGFCQAAVNDVSSLTAQPQGPRQHQELVHPLRPLYGTAEPGERIRALAEARP